MAFTYILASESKPSLSAKVTWTPVCKLYGEMHNTRKDRIFSHFDIFNLIYNPVFPNCDVMQYLLAGNCELLTFGCLIT